MIETTLRFSFATRRKEVCAVPEFEVHSFGRIHVVIFEFQFCIGGGFEQEEDHVHAHGQVLVVHIHQQLLQRRPVGTKASGEIILQTKDVHGFTGVGIQQLAHGVFNRHSAAARARAGATDDRTTSVRLQVGCHE